MQLIALLLGFLTLSLQGADGSQVGEALAPWELRTSRARGMAAFAAGDWARAEEELGRVVRAGVLDGEVLRLVGQARLNLGDWGGAIGAFERALELGCRYPAEVRYDLGVCHARAGATDDAFAWLFASMATGFESRSYAQRDPALASLHGDPRWLALVPPRAPDGADWIEGWRFDLDYLWAEIERLHVPNPESRSLADVRRSIEELKLRVPELGEERLVPQMQRILRSLGSGHSVVYPVASRLRLSELPLQFYWFPEGLTVIDATPEHAGLIGARVEAIGSRTSDRFRADLEPIVTRDNETGLAWFGPKYLQMTSYLLDLGYVDSTERIPLRLRMPTGEGREVELESRDVVLQNPRLVPNSGAPREGLAPVPLFLSRLEENYWHESLEGGALYVQFNQVWDQGGETLREYGLRLRRELLDGDVRDAILDLRHNNGGDPRLVLELLRTLIAFEAVHEENRLYVLFGRNTFSAAQNFLNDLERLTHAVLVGERSGSRPNMVGETTEVLLPYSGVQLSIGCRLYQDSGPADHRAWIAPHVPVELTAADYFAGRDPALEVVLQLIREERGESED